jgi:hypothetical protein
MTYWLSFYVEKRYPTIKPRKWWQFWIEPEIEMQTGCERLSFSLTEAEAQLFMKRTQAVDGLFIKFFPTATHLQLERGNLTTAYVKTESVCRNNLSHAEDPLATWKST